MDKEGGSRRGSGLDEHSLSGGMSEELLTEALPGLREFARRHRIRLILQFGSTVAGTTHDRSDLDLAAQFEGPSVPFQTVLEIQEALQAMFPGREVGQAILNRADPLFLKKILESCRLLFGKPQDFTRLGLYTFKASQNFRPYLELERRHVARRLAALVAEPSRP